MSLFSFIARSQLKVFILICVFSVKGLAGPGSKPWPNAWNTQMKELGQTLEELLLDLADQKKLETQKTQKRILENAKKISKLAHEVNQSQTLPDQDLSIKMLSKTFSEEAKFAFETLQSGNKKYAHTLLRSLAGNCVACHTRTQSGPAFTLSTNKPQFKTLGLLEKAELLTATRHFDQAIETYEQVLANPNLLPHSLELETVLRSSLAILIRVKKDPDRAISILDRINLSPKIPLFIKTQTLQWRKSLSDWKNELKNTPSSEEGYLAQAKKFIAQAKTTQNYPADRSADVLYLRATQVLHDFLNLYPQSKQLPQALYLIGLAYKVLQDLRLGDLHQTYFLNCIHLSPKTELAQNCYQHYEESVYFGYSGSGGTHLPREIKEILKKLEDIATPESKMQKEKP